MSAGDDAATPPPVDAEPAAQPEAPRPRRRWALRLLALLLLVLAAALSWRLTAPTQPGWTRFPR